MSDAYRRAVNRYLTWLGVVCLILLPSLGAGALVIWSLTALTLWGLFPKLVRPNAGAPRPKPTCRRKGRGR